MLDIKFIRENVELVKQAIIQKHVDINLDKLLDLDWELLEITKKLQAVLEEKNKNAKLVQKSCGKEREDLIARGQEIGQKLASLKEKEKAIKVQFQSLMYLVPNIPADFAPIGNDEKSNRVLKKIGEMPKFDFIPRNHRELIELNNWGDFSRSVKVAGERAYTLKGELLLIEMALHRMALHKLRKKGFEIQAVPSLGREFAFYGTGHFPKGQDQMYHLEKEDLYLTGTSEVFINSFHKDEILNRAELPRLYGAYGPCFRREAGSAGKDVGGLMRVHQFNKVEQYIICEASANESLRWHNFMLEMVEEILTDLELCYQLVECCTGDMGVGKYRMNDVETWVPSEQRFRETHSCSTMFEWQARRTNLRYRDVDGKVKFCHTLNCTAVATPRILIPLLECHQTKEGKVIIPKALQVFI